MALELIKNERVIEALAPGAKRLTDGGGLYLLPAAKLGGQHGWRFDYVFEGKRKTISLGIFPAVSLAGARGKALDARKQLALGINPSDKRKQVKAAQASQLEAERRAQAGEAPIGSFEEVARRWYAKNEEGWTASYAPKVLRRLEIHVFPYIGARPIASIEPPAVLEVCRRVEEQGTIETAHRALEHCSNVFRLAIAERLLPSDPCRDLRGALKKPVSKRFAAITDPAELADLLKATYAYQGTLVVRAALKLAPMLFLRPGELRQARWEEFDLDHGMWFVPSMRMKRVKAEKRSGAPHYVPLPKQAVDILEDLFCLTGKTGFVFPAEGRPGRTMSNGTVNAALRALGYTAEVVTGHGFRATARTLIAEVLSMDVAAVEMQLAHEVKDANGDAYNRAEYILKRQEIMQAWADYLDELREGRADLRRHAVLPAFKPVTLRLAA
ncbi:tyrosine-type recombinase/integrase [Aquabacterium sp. OR-4]|uniref:tyrosine-type recombinase/integrase n=1 Tax=Aquabacterium sp. OR-4 TaxID=2978127 RepID=UPI0021B2DE4C|nr:integrase arm-type DNA-binding domain-containing protein [Aquabacterium sp. OR-4]MDT7834092.1 tyrosine-type recombinase/integrase [Aquabacterium sp. OR-4]